MSVDLQFKIQDPKSTTAQRGFVPRRFSRVLLLFMVVAAMALSFGGVQWRAAKAAPKTPESQGLRFVELFADPLAVSPMAPAVMTFAVNTTNDTLLAGACAAAIPGQCSLREAMVEANANPGADTIDATSVTGTINLTAALPDITEDVTINGLGASLLTVRRDTGGDYRIFTMRTGGTVTLSGMTIRDGKVSLVGGLGGGGGGGILNSGTGTLNVTNSMLLANSAVAFGAEGGGIYNSNSGTLNVTNSTLSGNFTSSGAFGGGGISNDSGTLNVSDSTLDHNSCIGPCGGGGIASGGTLHVTNTTIRNNSAGAGGGILASAATVTNTTISNNSAESGGGIFTAGMFDVVNTTISNNRAAFGGGGGGIYNSGTLNVTNSTISGNSTFPGRQGGGIANSGTLNVNNSTITGNVAGALNTGGGVGGGIANGGGTVNVTNSTISGNFATTASGGIDNFGGTVNLKSSIVALNMAPNADNLNGTITSQGYNVMGTTSGATIVATTGDQFGVTAAQLKLDPLGNNGGPTQTMALQSGSVAIDQGINSNSLTHDQRGAGFARTFDDVAVTNAAGGDGTDVGAFEAQPPNQLPVAKCRNIQVSADSSCMASITPADVNDGSFDPDSGDTITLTLDNSGPFGLGAHTVQLTATDNRGASSSCTATVTVVDDTKPIISGESANPSVIWPPNKKMVLVTVNYTTSDNCDPNPLSVLSVSSNEGTSADWQIVDAHHVNLRADRAGNGNGRIYTIEITSTDASGNSTSKTVLVTVPHDQGH